MDFSRFFIDRPIFAAVLSIVIFVAGAIAIPLLPISEYPEVVPPTVVVQAAYPGANPKVIAETVSSPLEEQINGVENMMYMKSVAGSDGVLQMTITFAPGTDPNKAQVDVQNRVSQALSRLPSEVVSLGVTTQKQSPAFLTLITLISDDKYDALYLRNYANIRVKDQLARIPGVGQIRMVGGGDYAMRIWLDPDKIASRGMTAGDVVRAIQEQNIQVSAGQLGAEPIKGGSDFLIAINAQGRLRTAQEFGDVVLKTGSNGEVVRLSDVARIELGASDYTLRGQLDHYNTSIIGVFQAPGANALATRDAVIAKMDELARQFPPGVSYRSDYDATVFVRESVAAVIHTLFEAIALAVFVPMAFLTGVTGTFYKQFAVTIAISTVISAINSLTLSPALAAKLLHSHNAPKDMLSRLIERLLGWFFRPFNRFFKASSDSYQGAVSRTLGRRGVVFMVYVVLLAGTGLMFNAVPRGFIPTQDKLYLIAGVKLPEGSSLERTDAVLQRVKDIALATDGVAHVIGMTGLNPTQFTNTPNYAVAFPILKPFNQRHRSAKDIAADIQARIAKIKEGFAFVLNPPPLLRLGQGADYSLFASDHACAANGALQQPF